MDDDKETVGVGSIRLMGKKLDDLPAHQSRQAQLQIPDAIEAENRQKIEDIMAEYPRTTREYLESRLRECEKAIEDFRRVRGEKQAAIKNMMKLANDQHGKVTFKSIETELEAIGRRTDISFDEKKRLIRERRKECSDYDPAALYQQAEQFEADIERLDKAIESEQASILELRTTLGKIDHRDAELKKLGVTEIR